MAWGFKPKMSNFYNTVVDTLGKLRLLQGQAFLRRLAKGRLDVESTSSLPFATNDTARLLW